MAKAGQSHHLGADLIQVVEQLERHCLAPDGSYVSKSAYSDLQLAREEMSRERTRYLESLTLYIEAIAMVEEYQQSLASANVGGTREAQGHHPLVAEAAQRLRLPLVSKDGDIHEEEIEKLITMSRGSSDTTGAKVNSASNSTGYANMTNISSGLPNTPGVGGVPNHFLGITSDFLWKVQLQKAPISLDETHYQRSISSEMEGRLEAKCDKLADIFATVEIGMVKLEIKLNVFHFPFLFFFLSHIPNARLPERVKLITEEIEREETFLLQDLYSMDRKFAEHYSVLEQILSVLVKFVKDLKLQHQHKLDELRKDWLCKRCQTLNAKLRCLEYLLLCSTYNKDSVPALHRVREHLVEATAEASVAYNKAVTRLREYQGVDPHFDAIAMEYHDIVKKLEGMQWTIHQVEMDFRRSSDHQSSSYAL
ncbi:unnamed protein product [Spirodela intermedia]|uniref:Uncharacterized protein n=1 Tax=Spirodela intermedia TaxID=51605 RepID=A0A7I8I9V2_SPIIN|nr:unnamed protein product [Spirodela intermedia]CAA6653711.1 unnamed protein product [Spirodela intermedia]